MKIVAVTNRKGGVGKSTWATHIAAGLAIAGQNVAIVDADTQGHVSLMLGMPDENGLYNAMIEKKPLDQVVRYVPPDQYSTADHPARGNLYMLPSSDRTFRIAELLEDNETFLFLDVLEQMGQWLNLDTVIIDTAPTVNKFDSSIYLATDAYIFISQCEALSIDGVQVALDQLQKGAAQRRKYLARETQVLGIIPNQMRERTLLHRRNLQALAEAFAGKVWSPVMLRTIWAEATNSRQLVYTYMPSGPETNEAWRIVKHTMEALEAWHPTDATR